MRVARALLLLLGVVAFLSILHSDSIIFERLDRRVRRSAEHLGNYLRRKHAIRFLVSFEHGTPFDFVSNTPLLQNGVTVTNTPFGWGRHFDGHQRTFMASQHDLGDIGEQFSLSLRLMIKDASPNQHICFAFRQGGFGLALEDGYLTLYIPGEQNRVRYPFQKYGEYIDIVAVADAKSGYAALYENGIKKASSSISELSGIPHNVVFSMTRWDKSTQPFSGVICEAAMWDKALELAEIKELHTDRRRFIDIYGGRYVWQNRFYTRFRNGLRALLKTSDHFNVFLHQGVLDSDDLPTIDLFLTRSDLRYLQASHIENRLTGIRLPSASEQRTVDVWFDNAHSSGEICLHSVGYWYDQNSERPSFLLRFDDSSHQQAIFLSPPESEDWIVTRLKAEVAHRTGVPHRSVGLCRLLINGEFAGVYSYRNYDKKGVVAGQATRVFFGPTNAHDWRSLFHQAENPLLQVSPLGNTSPFNFDALTAIYDELAEKYSRFLINDYLGPLSRRAIRHRIRRTRAKLHDYFTFPADDASGVDRYYDLLNEYMFLGSNPSPFFVTDNLDLEAFHLIGGHIEWSSDRPDVISQNGEVTRPTGRLPVEVSLIARFSHGDGMGSKTLSFRVMPRELGFPVMMLYANEQLVKTRRAEAVLHYYKEGTCGTAPLRYYATVGGRGGIAHRGNTSYWLNKKPFGLRLDDPHQILDDTTTRHMYFTTGYADNTRMRHTLSYDLFRSFSRPGMPRFAPTVLWTEVFVNGQYMGIYECKTRIQRRKLGFPSFDPSMEEHGQLFKRTHQKYPQPKWGCYADEYMHMRERMRQIDPAEGIAAFAEYIDIDSAVDYQLLVNILDGRDNVNANYFLAKDPGEDQAYYFVAWDMKKNMIGSTRYYRHHLLRNLSQVDAFQELLRQRWKEVRDGPASLSRMLEKIDQMEAYLSGYMEWEFDLWRFNGGREYKELVNALRANMKRRYEWLEEHFAVE